MSQRDRPELTADLVSRVRVVLDTLPEVEEEDAWIGVRWRVHGATVAHLFGGEDQLFRIVLRGQPADVSAFEHLGSPYFRAGWGDNVIGMVLDDQSDWGEVAELLIESYCIQAPQRLVERLDLPPAPQ